MHGTTPNSATCMSPAQMMFQHTPSNGIPLVQQQPSHSSTE